MRRRGNPNFCKREMTPAEVMPTAFEKFCTEHRLDTRQKQVRSYLLRDWARKNRNNKYVPENLLDAWGMDVFA